jgi:amino acid adenylation domain-containing protein
VGLAAVRSPDLVVGILGILRAGATLVPLDPAHPAERLALLLEDSGLTAVVAQSGLEAKLPAGAPPVILLEDVGDDAWSEAVAVPADALAYVIYTSGSTGRPKGVGVSHASLVPMLRWSLSTFGLGEGRRVLQTLSYAFDFGLWEILTAVVSGAALHIPPVAETGDPEAFARRAVEEGIDTVHATPSFFRAVAETGARLEGLRVLHLGGEALSRSLVERLAAAVGEGCTLYNGYGPTEATVNSLLFEIGRPGHLSGLERTPIGRPSAENAVYVVDPRGSAVPVGVPGELQIGGPGVARGYLGRPELTAERFVPDGFSGEPGVRLYRSGDRVRWRTDGTVEFLGRVDDQVKIRGFRIEPGEIEAALRLHPEVREAVVMARDLPGGAALVAYVVSGEDSGDLREFLRGRLPAALVPAAFVRLDGLPLTPTGKVDRRALPAPAFAEPEERETPRTPVEAALAGIFGEVLGIAEVGRTDSFFHFGGHSLLATRVVSRVREAMGVELPLRTLFEAPTVAALALRVEELSRAGLKPPPSRVEEWVETGEPPLSFAQQRLWFLDRLQPGSALYNLPLACRLRGALDAGALAATLGEIARRHEALRTRFAEGADGPVQVIDPPSPFVLPEVDLRGLAEPARRREAARLAAAEAARPFDLANGPLLRGVLLRLEADERVLALTLHHIVADAWSMEVMLREIETIYGAAVQGLPSPLPEPPVQYADFAVWQRRWLRGRELEAQLAYWRQRLAGHPPLMELPTDRPRPAARTDAGASEPFLLGAEAAGRLRDLSRLCGMPLFMTGLAGFLALLARYTGQTDLLVGTPTAGRGRLEVEGLIGFFVNLLVLRTDAGGDPTFSELLGRVRETALGAYAHDDLPFERLIEEVAPERNLSHSPLFQVMFVLHPKPAAERSRMAGVEIEPLAPAGGRAKYDLTVSLTDGGDSGDGGDAGGGLAGEVEVNLDLFDAATARRMGRHLEVLLAGAALQPEARLSDLPLLTSAERDELLREWQGPAGEIPPVPLVHEMAAAAAREHPGSLAVAAGDRRLTQGELHARANRLAHHLRSLGVGPDVVVGICTGWSLERVVGILAVLKAGGAYASFDPAYPPERLALAIADARVLLLLTESPFRDRVPAAVPVLCLDLDLEKLTGDESHPPAVEVHPENLAYVIFTSGSTGRPKGVAVPHRALSNLVRWHHQVLGVTPGDRGTQVSSLAFDSSVLELWPFLAAGAGTCIPAEEIRLSAARMLRWWAEEGITLADLPTPLADAVLEEEPAAALLPALPLRLRVLSTGGDRLRHAPRPEAPFRLLNTYGPAEYGVIATMAFVPPAAPDATDRAPSIGRAILNTRVHVLDAGQRLVPVGVPGELCISGEGLARGYLWQPALTAERFLPDPFAAEAGGRMYRTGDRVRRLADGDLDFLGRSDHQVKIRGMRVELGEIEALLGQHPAVRQAVVLVPAGRLTAYLTPAAEGAPPASGELRSFLAVRLPAYMVPQDWVLLDALPLTPNGKVDRRALAAIAVAVPREAYQAPRTPLERALAAVWAELLPVDPAAPIGVRDDFFHLGGHSLLAIQVASRLRRALGIEVEIRTLFEAPTIEGLARRIEADRPPAPEATALAAPPLRPVPRGPGERLPLSFAQERLWFLDQLEPGSPAYNLPGGVRVEGALEPAVLARALSEIVRRHEALRTRFAVWEGAPVQIVAAAAPLPLPRVDLRALPDAARAEEARRLAREEVLRSFDLSGPGGAPLLRATLLRLAAEDWICLLTQHHIGSDGWSAGVLGAELPVLYGALLAGGPSPLPELPLQYGDYAVWQRRWLAGEVLAGELAWWRRHLDGAPAVLELPTDHPRPAVASPLGGREGLVLPRELRQALERLGRSEGATLFMTLLAAFGLLLSRYAGPSDLLVGSPVAGRSRRELEGLIGFFVNTLALRVSLEGEPSFRELLARAREETLAVLAHQDLPFERLVEELAPERSLDRNPLFQVMLAVQEAGPALVAPGLTFRRVELEGGTAKFDLSLEVGVEEEGLGVWIEYRRDLFEAATVRRMAGHLAALLAGALADAGAPAAALPLLTVAEREELAGWHRSPGTWAVPGTVQGLFAEQARLHPAAAALVAGERTMSYGELARRSGALARALRRLGAGPEVRVGLAAERSPELVVGILGILRAGATLVPLDPAHPSERLALLLEDSGLAVVVTQGALAAKLGDGGPPVVVLEEVADADGSDEDVDLPAGALAYVIYTSGSTGRPKGVGVAHANVVPMLLWSRATFGLGPGRRVLQSLSYAFDFGLWEILSTIVSGAALHIPPAAETGDPEAFARRAVEEGIDTVHATPSFFRAVAETGARLEGLRVLHLGGEALSRSLVARLAAAVGEGCTLYNGYGPTEATVNSLLFEIGRPGSLSGLERTPIGRPSAENAVYGVDRLGAEVPVGVPGELRVGGPGVARGYLGRPELTAERFVPDDLGGERGGRLYRTGDLVRRRADGMVEFLGRVDDQVKIRGFRIEPGEIEAALRGHPGVREAVVVARELPGGAALVAYVAAAEGDADPGELRDFLRGRLPAALVPAAFVRLDALPLTATGKLDRRALPEPVFDGRAGGGERERPRTPIEEILAGVFAEVLGVSGVARTDSFFHLGGHSLLATRVVARVRDALGVELPLRSLFEAPTVMSLAERVESTLRVGLALLPPIERADRGGELPLSFAQERLWRLDQLDPGRPFHNLPGAVRLAGRLEPAALAWALSEILRRHEVLRTRFAAGPDGPVQIVQPAGALALPEVDLRALPAAAGEGEVARLAREEARRPFAPGGPLLRALLRAVLLRSAGEEWICLLTLHALAADRGSAGVLLGELAALYGAALAGGPADSRPPEPPLQVGDFAVWQRRWLAGEALAGDLIWWWERLSGAPTVLALPADRPRPVAASGVGGREPVAIPPELRRGLERLGRREDATLQMTVLAAFAALLARAADQEELLVGLPVSGRPRRELEGVIGPFANVLALRVSLAGGPSFRELLVRVRDETLAALAHQELPFECLVEALAPEPDLDRAPLFQVAVALREAPVELAAPGLTLRPVELAAAAPRLDLSLELRPEGEGLAGWIEYRRDLFDAATVRRLAGDLVTSLRAAVEDGQVLTYPALQVQASTQAQLPKELLE